MWWWFSPNIKHADFYFFGSFSVKSVLFELVQPPLLRASSKQNGNHAVLLYGTFDIGLVILTCFLLGPSLINLSLGGILVSCGQFDTGFG